MNNLDFQYLAIAKKIKETGFHVSNRTGFSAKTIAGAVIQHDVGENGLAMLTTKAVAHKSVTAELIGFIHGLTSAKDFRAFGTKIWDKNANETSAWLQNKNRVGEDDLGHIYGYVWNNWNSCRIYDSSDKEIGIESADWFSNPESPWLKEAKVSDFSHAVLKSENQILKAAHTIINNPTDRRILISGWKVDELDFMALPPCHVLYQFIPDPISKKLHLVMYQRSCDFFLGVPFNLVSCSIFLEYMARITGYSAGTFTHMLGNVHIYDIHSEQLDLQSTRTPMSCKPSFIFDDSVFDYKKENRLPTYEDILSLKPSELGNFVYGYISHPAIKGEMPA